MHCKPRTSCAFFAARALEAAGVQFLVEGDAAGSEGVACERRDTSRLTP